MSQSPEQRGYRQEPDHSISGFPPGIAYIIGNEGCERFSYYGMKAILYVYLTYLLSQSGVVDADRHATAVAHTFFAGVYALPLVGAMLADRLLGKYPTIILLSLVYCAGHACLAVFDGNFQGFATGLFLIALGAGGIKPCVSAHVGDQFGRGNWHRLSSVYGAFYFIINLGSTFSSLLVPWLKEAYGWSIAFAVPGVLMGIATLFFWLGRRVFVHVPPKPGGLLGVLDVACGTFFFLAVALPMFGADLVPGYSGYGWPLRIVLSSGLVGLGLWVFAVRQKIALDDGFLTVLLFATWARVRGGRQAGRGFWETAVDSLGASPVRDARAVLRISSVFVMVSVFWALFDQYASSWVEQAKRMDRHFVVLGFDFVVLPEQISAVNPILVMLLIPAMTLVGYPALEKATGRSMTPLTRMTLGMFVAALSFVFVAMLQRWLDSGEHVHVVWQLGAFLVLTLAEVMVSVTGLEFAYTQAPPRMKSLIMGLWLFTAALGNTLVAFLAGFRSLSWESFFWVFAALMAGAAFIFGWRARHYVYETYER